MNHLLLVFTECVPGREDDFHAWYDSYHVPDVLRTPGIVAAQRFALAQVEEPKMTEGNTYLCVYEVEGVLDDAMAALAATRHERVRSDAIDDAKTRRYVYTAITDRVTASVPPKVPAPVGSSGSSPRSTP